MLLLPSRNIMSAQERPLAGDGQRPAERLPGVAGAGLELPGEHRLHRRLLPEDPARREAPLDRAHGRGRPGRGREGLRGGARPRHERHQVLHVGPVGPGPLHAGRERTIHK